MPKTTSKTVLRARPAALISAGPWWLEGADEACPHCLQAYAYGLHYRCSQCDGEVCAHCVVELRASVEFFCPPCDDRSGESS
jgi:hypothetical protein